MGCGAHIVHNSAITACDIIRVDVEVVVHEIFSYFHIHTVGVEKRKDFCEFVDVQNTAILSRGVTRWLSLFPAVERMLNLFDALKEFFKAELRCPTFLANFFEDPRSELWLWFIHNQMSLFNTTLLTLQKEDATASEVAFEIHLFKGKLLSWRDEKFSNLKVISSLRELKNNKVVTTKQFFDKATSFYQTAFDYIEKWDTHFCP